MVFKYLVKDIHLFSIKVNVVLLIEASFFEYIAVKLFQSS